MRCSLLLAALLLGAAAAVTAQEVGGSLSGSRVAPLPGLLLSMRAGAGEAACSFLSPTQALCPLPTSADRAEPRQRWLRPAATRPARQPPGQARGWRSDADLGPSSQR